jgi:phosphatidylglycerol lysyltransferase
LRSRSTSRDFLLEALQAHGRDAVAYQALEPGLSHWQHPKGVVTYSKTRGGWAAVGGPLATADAIDEVAQAFVAEARREGRRGFFFACDDVSCFGGGFARVQLGEQPLWQPAAWATTLREQRGLREQLRRARAKGVVVRRVPHEELEGSSPLRREIDALAARWLASRPMEPMHFLVTLDLFEEPQLHWYYVAERAGAVVACMSVIPAGGSRRLVEDLVRDRHAPNGTTELLFDRAMSEAADDHVERVTWGLAPLAGPVPLAMRMIGALGRGLYDFRGLKAFKARLHPSSWEPVWLVYPRETSAPLCMLDALRAFAGGALVTFGLRTFARHPLVLAWALTLGLIPWTALLALMLAFHAAVPLFGFPRPQLFAWVVFDATFVALLLRAFWRPRTGMFLLLSLAAAADAAWSILHVAHVGLGPSAAAAVIRLASMTAPGLAAFGLLRCAAHAQKQVA